MSIPTLGLELSDVGLLTATCNGGDPQPVAVADLNGSTDWPGFVCAEGDRLVFGRTAEDLWFIHPRHVAYNFWSRLTHEPSTLSTGTKPPSFSELAFFFLREFSGRLHAGSTPFEQIVIAVPGAYLKDRATEDEKIGLLLGIAAELKLPVAGLIDLSCAALCDPRAAGFNPALPVVVVDVNLEGAELTLLTAGEQLTRRDFLHLPQSGYAQLLKQLTGTMGNRFLRHTAFDILEDGRIEQTFYRQTKDFVVSDADECRFHINTATRAYEMLAKREQLVADAQAFVTSLVQSLQTFVRNSPHGSEPLTVALTERASHLPGLEARLRSAGFGRLLSLPPGAAACGAARIGSSRLRRPEDLAEAPLETSVPLDDTRRLTSVQWEARLQKNREPGARFAPTHAILGGLGHIIGRSPRFVVGLAESGADLPLPPAFSTVEDLAVSLLREDGRLWFVDPASARTLDGSEAPAMRTAIDAGDRLTVSCGTTSAEILFAHCPSPNATRMD